MCAEHPLLFFIQSIVVWARCEMLAVLAFRSAESRQRPFRLVPATCSIIVRGNSGRGATLFLLQEYREYANMTYNYDDAVRRERRSVRLVGVVASVAICICYYLLWIGL